MSNAMDLINSSFNDSRRDTTFDPSLLKELNDEDRRVVEDKIIKLCLYGDRVSYQYIPYLEMYNPEDVFTDELLTDLKPFDKSLIYKSIYSGTSDDKYLDKMIDISKKDINTYSMLTLMAMDGELNDKYKDALRDIAYFNEDENYKKMYDIRVNSHTDENNKTK